MVKHTLVSDKESSDIINTLKRRASFETNSDISVSQVITAILKVMDTEKVICVLKNGQEYGDESEIENN